MRRPAVFTRLLLITAFAISIAGCGGGGAGNVSSSLPSQGAPPPASATLPQLIYVASSAFFTGLGNAITVYRADATGNVPPVNTIAGRNSMIQNPAYLAFDGAANLYVSTDNVVGGLGCVQVFAPGSSDDTAPIRSICGLDTPAGIAFDRHGFLFVANLRGGEDTNGTVTVYPPLANGNVAPSFTLSGPKTGLKFPIGLAFDSSGNLYVANFGGTAETARITVYAAGACSGDVPPIATIEGPKTTLINPTDVALDSSGNIYVSDQSDAIDVFARGANGDVAPIRRIAGPNTMLLAPAGIQIDESGTIYESGGPSVAVFAPGATGDVVPIRLIIGSNTKLSAVGGLALH